MKRAEEISKEHNLGLPKKILEYLDKFMEYIRFNKLWVDDTEKSIRVEEMRFTMENFLSMSKEEIRLFEREALNEKYGCLILND